MSSLLTKQAKPGNGSGAPHHTRAVPRLGLSSGVIWCDVLLMGFITKDTSVCRRICAAIGTTFNTIS